LLRVSNYGARGVLRGLLDISENLWTSGEKFITKLQTKQSTHQKFSAY